MDARFNCLGWDCLVLVLYYVVLPGLVFLISVSAHLVAYIVIHSFSEL